MRNDILHTIHYFAFFQYPPTLQELYIFHKKDISYRQFKAILKQLVDEKILKEKVYKRKNNSIFRYTAWGYDNFFNVWEERSDNVKRKIIKLYTFVQYLSRFTSIQLVGLSGSVSMKNCEKDDDIDLFIISRKNRLWTARFCAVMLAGLLGVRRKRQGSDIKDKICLNLFFDENNLSLPLIKHTEYAGHEVLQMKPVAARGDTYVRFLDANKWVFDIFPNAQKRSMPRIIPWPTRREIPLIGDMIERMLKYLQLLIMSRRRRDERITSTQLWFFPDDFEKKLKITS